MELRDGEYIEEFKIRIKGGRVSAIQRIPDDWDIAVEWEDGSCGAARRDISAEDCRTLLG
jgi:hypothetical protein